MRYFRVLVSFDVDAEDEEDAYRQAANIVTDSTMCVEAISEWPTPTVADSNPAE